MAFWVGGKHQLWGAPNRGGRPQRPNMAAEKGRGPRSTAVTAESILAWSPATPLQPH